MDEDDFDVLCRTRRLCDLEDDFRRFDIAGIGGERRCAARLGDDRFDWRRRRRRWWGRRDVFLELDLVVDVGDLIYGGRLLRVHHEVDGHRVADMIESGHAMLENTGDLDRRADENWWWSDSELVVINESVEIDRLTQIESEA